MVRLIRDWLLGVMAALSTVSVAAEWPMLRGGPEHTGYVEARLTPPFRLAWAVQIRGERLGTAMEPIVGAGRVYVATHQGRVFALDARTGAPVWRFEARGPFLQSPAFAGDRLVAPCSAGFVYILDARSGEEQHSRFLDSHGFAASPLIDGDRIFLVSRGGECYALDLESGRTLWRRSLGIPIRQTPALSGGRLFVTTEEPRVFCLEAAGGNLLWKSEALVGQTARDYYPVVVRSGGRTNIVVRTNPLLGMAQQIARDRHMLCLNAGVDDSGWEKIDAWIKSPEAQGNPELWEREQRAIIEYLEKTPEARTFFVLDAVTGAMRPFAPVLWIAGCQAVGAQPALTADGRLLVFYRSAYGNWNHGVAPLVALGLLDLGQNRITPLSHQHGRRPAWNTFWGTADESQNFLVAGNTVLIVHQGTLSGFDLSRQELFRIHGERDTYGGFANPPWARNEWHGPGRSGVAVTDGRIFWQTGSRILCLVSEQTGDPADVSEIDPDQVPTRKSSAADDSRVASAVLSERLERTAAEILSAVWAPLFVEPGLAGRDFSFDHSGELFEAISWAYPFLSGNLKDRALALLDEQWRTHPPFKGEAWYRLGEGTPREWSAIPARLRTRIGADKRHHPFGNVHAVWLYEKRCGRSDAVLAEWPELRQVFLDFRKIGWRLDGAKGDLYANRYLASLLALARLAWQANDREVEKEAVGLAEETMEELVRWWEEAARDTPLGTFKGSGQLDPFIGRGDRLSFRVASHQHTLALFNDLTPEIAEFLRKRAPEAVDRIWTQFESLYATWHLQGEERQVHFGENFVDPPDLALGAFKAMAWIRNAPPDDLARKVDIPFCRADLYHLTKLALALEQHREN